MKIQKTRKKRRTKQERCDKKKIMAKKGNVIESKIVVFSFLEGMIK